MRPADGIPPLIAVDRRRKQPLHRQIGDGIRAAIERGELRPGQRVPSSRQMAAELAVSRLPVLAAYAQLLSEGWLETRGSAGTFAAKRWAGGARPARAAADAGAGPQAARPLARSVAALPAFERPVWMGGWGAFGVHQPALERFPYRVWGNLLLRHSRQVPTLVKRRIDPMGCERLREAICAYLRTARGVQCEPSQVMVVCGSQQALDLCTRVLCDPGAPVWMEEPGYWLARRAFELGGCRMVPVPVDAEGLDVAAGRRACRRARLAYVTPSHQYPLGVTLSEPRRRQLLEWAREAGAWILEDDYDGEYAHPAAPVLSLQGLDADRRVVYIGTFSKVLYPSLRLGYLVLPPDLVGPFAKVRVARDIGPSHLGQEALADFIHEGHFARHARHMRRLYRERREALTRALRGPLAAGWEIPGAATGMHLALTAPAGLDDQAAAVRAARQGLWLWPLSPAYAGSQPRPGFILGFGSTAAEAMPAAVERMGTALTSV